MQTDRWIRLTPFLWLTAAIWISGCTGFRADRQEKDLGRLTSLAQQTDDEIRNRLNRSPDSILNESLQTLDAILEYADQVKSDPKRFDPSLIEEYTRKIDIIRTNIERFNDLTLQADISFPPGAFRVSDLSSTARTRINGLKDRIVETVKDLQSEYPGYPIRIILKTVGYTDLAPIAPDTSLEAALRDQVADPAPPGPARQRQYNKALARLRSVSVNRFLRDRIQKEIPDADIRFELRNIGKGEALPMPHAEPAYKPIDGRRRICIISPFIEIVI